MFDCGAYPLGGDYATSDRVCRITSDCARRLVASHTSDFAPFDIFLFWKMLSFDYLVDIKQLHDAIRYVSDNKAIQDDPVNL